MRKRDENGEVRPSWEEMTEEYSFDELARGLASGTISRRKALKLVGSAILGAGVLAAIPARPAEAAECGSTAGCTRRCRDTRRCRCVRTVTGNVRCVRPCCSRRTCNQNSDCRSTELCMTTNCCGGTGSDEGICVTTCQAPRPNYCDRTAAQSGTTDSAGAEWGSAA